MSQQKQNLSLHRCLVNTPLLLSRDAISEVFNRISANVIEEQFAGEIFDWGYSVEGNVGILPVRGALAQRPDLIHMYLGGSSVDMLRKHFQALLANDEITCIVLDIDSPGGYVSPIAEFSDLLYQSRGQGKRIIASVNSMAASAAYWIASAADEILMNDSTAMAGSVGVYIAHLDVSKFEERIGFKTTEITAGRYKAIASPYAPLSEEGKETLQARADYIYSIFVDAVARYRRLDTAKIEDWADGKVFIGQQAVDAGLADRVESFSAIITGASVMTEPKQAAAPPAPAPEITEAYLAANHPKLLAGIKTRAYEDGQKAGIEAGRKAERERYMAIETLEKAPAFQGYDDVFTKAKAEGMTKSECHDLLIQEQLDRGPAANLRNMQADATMAGTFSGHGEGNDEEEIQALLKSAADAVNVGRKR